MELIFHIMVTIGAVFLAASSKPLCDVLRLLKNPKLRRAWGVLCFMNFAFLLGYIAIGLEDVEGSATFETTVVGAILLAGGLFVFIVSHLTRLTARDLTRLGELEWEARIDALTGVFNRRELDMRLKHEFAVAMCDNTPLTVMMVDLDHFKRINDTYGHKAGDQVLENVARLLTQLSRHGDLIFRYGGEEFLIMAPGLEAYAAPLVAERYLLGLRNEEIHIEDGGRLCVTASIGLASLRSGDTVSSLVSRADRSLYHAKKTGRNRYFSEEQEDAIASPSKSRFEKRLNDISRR